jgi:CRP/FNR family cyclic AMP-dependent transcriptional regulator
MIGPSAMTTGIESTLYPEFGCEYTADKVIFGEGDPGNLVYIIQSGKVRIDKKVGDRTKVLGVLSAGDFLGEMALVSDRPRSATATVVEDCRLLALDREMFFRMMRSDCDAAMKIIGQLAARLAEADRRLEVLLFTDATARLVRHLEGISEDTLQVELPHLAFELGVPLDRLRRIVDKLAAKGIIEFGGGTLVVRDRGKLDKLREYLLLREEFGQVD